MQPELSIRVPNVLLRDHSLLVVVPDACPLCDAHSATLKQARRGRDQTRQRESAAADPPGLHWRARSSMLWIVETSKQVDK
jgi:hypothetical protein